MAFVTSGGQKQAHYSHFSYDDVGEASAPKKKKKKKKLALPAPSSEPQDGELDGEGTQNGSVPAGTGDDEFIE